MDERLAGLDAWLQSRLAGTPFQLEPASADASFRRYFRVTTREHSMIAMDAPPDKEDSAPFVRVARLLAQSGVNVPQLIEFDLERGFLLLTDLGSQLYLGALQSYPDTEPLYKDALRCLISIQAGAGSSDLPTFDRRFLATEMALFRDWLLGRHLEIQLAGPDADRLQASFEYLTESALAQPALFVHRDFHSRNLMVCPDNNPGVLDFQDAMRGPVTYDLVSLLKDCYLKLPQSRVSEYLAFYREHAAAAGIPTGPDATTFQTWFDLMGVQRHLKASGIFARLWHRDGKRGYLADIPRTLSYICDCADSYPQLAFLSELIKQRVLPSLQAETTQ